MNQQTNFSLKEKSTTFGGPLRHKMSQKKRVWRHEIYKFENKNFEIAKFFPCFFPS